MGSSEMDKSPKEAKQAKESKPPNSQVTVVGAKREYCVEWVARKFDRRLWVTQFETYKRFPHTFGIGLVFSKETSYQKQKSIFP